MPKKLSADRIKALELALQPFIDAGDGLYVKWRDRHTYNEYGPYCMYCGAEWDRNSGYPPDSHADHCPVALARAALEG